jgi:hypothetical protein
VAAAGAGVDRWLRCRGRRSEFRRDRFHRAPARPGPVPGGTDFLIDGIRVGRTDALRRLCLRARVLLSERIIVPGHTSAGERSCILRGAFVPVADRIRIPEVIPVRLSDPVPFPDPDPDPDPADVPDSVHARDPGPVGEHIAIRIGFCVVPRPATFIHGRRVGEGVRQ